MKLYLRLLLTFLATKSGFIQSLLATEPYPEKELASNAHDEHYADYLNGFNSDPLTQALQLHEDEIRAAIERKVALTLKSLTPDTSYDLEKLQALIQQISASILNTPEGFIVATELHNANPEISINSKNISPTSPATTPNEDKLKTVNDFVASVVKKDIQTAQDKKINLTDLTPKDIHDNTRATSNEKIDDIEKVRPQNPNLRPQPPVSLPTTSTTPIENIPAGTAGSNDSAQDTDSSEDPNSTTENPTTTPDSGSSTPNTVSSLIYDGQDLAQYTALTHITIPASQLGAPITSTRDLHTTITDDAAGAALNLENLKFKVSTLNLSAVTNILNNHVDITTYVGGSIDTLIIAGGNLNSISAPDTLPTLLSDASQLANIALVGAAGTSLPTWVNDTNMAANATLNVTGMPALTSVNFSGHDDIAHLIAADTLTTLTIDAGQIQSIRLTGNTTTALPSWITTNDNYATNSTLDISGLTNLASTDLNISTLTNLSSVIAPSSVTGTITLSNSVTSLTAAPTLNTLIAGDTLTTPTGPTALTSIVLSGSAASVPTWATNGSKTGAGAVLNLSAMTGLGTSIDLSTLDASITTVILPTSITTIIAPDTLTTLTGPTALTSITISGSAVSVPTWAVNGSLTAANTTLNLTGMTSPLLLDVSGDTNITTLNANKLNALTAHENLANVTGASTPTLAFIEIVGTAKTNLTTLAWATNGSLTSSSSGTMLELSRMTALAAPLNLSTVNNSIVNVSVSGISNITLSGAVTTLTADATLTTLTASEKLLNLSGPTALSSITLSGTSETDISNLTWLNTAAQIAPGAALNLTNMIGLTSPLDLSGISNNITSVTVTGVSNLTLPNTVTSLNADATLTTLTASDNLASIAGGANALTSITLSGSTASVPTWATNGSTTSAGATLNLSAMTGLGTSIDLSALDASITTVILPASVTAIISPDTLTTLTGPTALTSVTVSGSTASVPTWVTNGSLTAASTTLNVSGMTALITIDISGDANITTLSSDEDLVTVTTAADQLEYIIVSGTAKADLATLAWVNDAAKTAANATLDISGMTALTAANITNTDITTIEANYGAAWAGNKLELAVAHANVTLALVGDLAGGNPTLDMITTNKDKVTTLDLTGLTSLPAAVTIGHVSELSVNVTTVDLTGSGVTDVTASENNGGATTFTLHDGVTTVVK